MNRGFLGYDASFMLDVVVCALILLVPLLVYSIWLVKYRHKYGKHKVAQLLMGLLLLTAVGLFEIDMQLHGGWKNIINKDPAAPRMSTAELADVSQILRIHLIFAISTPILWIWTTYEALRRFPDPIKPGPYSKRHKTLAWLSTIDLVLTSITGLIFYYYAFIA
ncbi:DUF420 domain-containing protein [Rubinisphaera italica]|uniref:DUF420 domain-containing protein n=1 Tax=Rubinisphaera italica TaxID=2527969 RepID=A0A5C5XLV3_9PLAN|nr:DUF420 domain-containing protein [Rubinisphaera italica]TWT64167.1 hypothetical protein Pan54_49280 [Rubinisphaera italica]